MCAYLKQRKKENQHKTPTSTVEIKDVTTAAVGVLPLRSVTRSQTSPPTKQSVPTTLDTDLIAQERLRDQMMREVRQLQNELEEPTSAPSITPQATPHHLNGILRHYLNMTIWFPIHNRTIRRRP